MKKIVLSIALMAASTYSVKTYADIITVRGGGGVVKEGGKTTYCPSPGDICATIETSKPALAVGDVVSVTPVVTGKPETVQVISISGSAAPDGSYMGRQLTFRSLSGE